MQLVFALFKFEIIQCSYRRVFVIEHFVICIIGEYCLYLYALEMLKNIADDDVHDKICLFRLCTSSL